jgi:protein Tex
LAISVSEFNTGHIKTVSSELSVKPWQVENTAKLLGEGATIPFISRYRKEATGELDEVQVESIRDRLAKLLEIDNRRIAILNEIDKQGKLTDELKALIESANTITELEDLYLPYKPKRRTRADIAREKGLEDLAKLIFEQDCSDCENEALRFLNDKVENIIEALQGARDIIAEWINEDKRARDSIREVFKNEAIIRSRIYEGLEEPGAKYRDYFEFEEELTKCPSHRLLAIRRGESEEFLKVSITISEENAIAALEKIFMKEDSGKKVSPANKSSEQVRTAIRDSFKRLLAPSIETEFAKSSKESADDEAIKVFGLNLRQLLLAPFLGQKSVLALDPGYRTGCKLVVLNQQGDLLLNDTIYPHQPQNKTEESGRKLAGLVAEYNIEAIAIGNGTASRETKEFVESIDFGRPVKVFVVSENGASIYSASAAAREEFPDHDVTVKGAVSIGRRLMDPLAELVKIEPKNLGIGQYQHDVDQNKLKENLDRVVESSVNMVGVNLNTASKHLLTYVSGLGPALALNIVNYRKENGPFKSRPELLKVSRMGEKAYVQCAGFLRIQDGSNLLDNSAVHPESYYIVEKMAERLGCNIASLIAEEKLRVQINIGDFVDEKTGIPTLKDIIKELAKPGRDPRKSITIFEFKKDVKTIEDLKPGMLLPGIVTNITNFGAFVDVGVKQDGLVHISQISKEFIKNPAEKLSLHQEVMVKVLEVDISRKRIQLSIREAL